ncbi:hypothetical protein ES703_14270 [subsurface metagenome]
MDISEVKEIIAKAYQRLDEKGKPKVLSMRVGYTEELYTKKLCDAIGITKDNYLRICKDFFESYMSQLDEEELRKEQIRIHKFVYPKRTNK